MYYYGEWSIRPVLIVGSLLPGKELMDEINKKHKDFMEIKRLKTREEEINYGNDIFIQPT